MVELLAGVVSPYGDPGDMSGISSVGAYMAMMVMFMGVMSLVGVVVYVITAFNMMKIAEQAGHKQPWAAWVPIMNMAQMFELGGVRGAWPWTLIVFGLSLTGGIPVVGVVTSFALLALTLWLTYYMIRGIQRGFGIESTGLVVLGMLLTVVWVFVIRSKIKGAPFSIQTAVASSDEMQIKWFKDKDPYVQYR